MPVVVLDDLDHAVPVARALVAGGLPVIELTLRTPVALDAIAAIAAEVPEILVGAGTIISPGPARAPSTAGAQFLVSPGTTPALLAAMADSGLPFLPGTATVSEAMAVLEAGYTRDEVLPRRGLGGRGVPEVDRLPAAGGPLLPHRRHHRATAPSYLALPNVGCVGGSWLTPADALAAGDWDRVAALAREAAALGVLTLRVRAVDNQPGVRGVPEAPAPPAATAAPCRTPSRSTPTKVAHVSTTSCLPALTAPLAPPAGAATALLLPAALLAGAQPGSASGSAPAVGTAASDDVPADVSVRASGHQRIRLEALPQVVQPGGAVASPSAARSAVVATLRPVRPGRRVQLQVQEGECGGRSPRGGRTGSAACSSPPPLRSTASP